jgi:hypothetical protein
MEWLPKGLTAKASTSNVRSGYLMCLLEAVSSANNSSEVSKSLMKIVENAVRQPSQVAIVSEAVHAVACCVKMRPDEVEDATNDFFKVLKSFLNPQQSHKKQLKIFLKSPKKVQFCI